MFTLITPAPTSQQKDPVHVINSHGGRQASSRHLGHEHVIFPRRGLETVLKQRGLNFESQNRMNFWTERILYIIYPTTAQNEFQNTDEWPVGRIVAVKTPNSLVLAFSRHILDIREISSLENPWRTNPDKYELLGQPLTNPIKSVFLASVLIELKHRRPCNHYALSIYLSIYLQACMHETIDHV